MERLLKKKLFFYFPQPESQRARDVIRLSLGERFYNSCNFLRILGKLPNKIDASVVLKSVLENACLRCGSCNYDDPVSTSVE